VEDESVKRIAWLLIVVASVTAGWPAGSETSGLASSGRFRSLVFAPAVADNLALFFEKFDTELVLCLEGERRGADLYITDFRVPHIFMSETGRVQAASCRTGSRSVGTWHNHPAPHLRMASASADVLARNCYLSGTDITDFQRRSEAQVTVVSCAPRTYAYWRRDDVERLAGEVALLPPPVGQLVQSEVQDDQGTSGLTQARGQ
jgi:hypothetical protein